MPVHTALLKSFRLFLAIFHLRELHGPIHHYENGVTLKGQQNIRFRTILISCSENVGLPLENAGLCLDSIVQEVFLLVCAVELDIV